MCHLQYAIGVQTVVVVTGAEVGKPECAIQIVNGDLLLRVARSE